MTTELKESIVEVLQQHREGMTLAGLLDELRQRGLPDQTRAKAAVWSLVAQARAELTPSRMIRPVADRQE